VSSASSLLRVRRTNWIATRSRAYEVPRSGSPSEFRHRGARELRQHATRIDQRITDRSQPGQAGSIAAAGGSRRDIAALAHWTRKRELGLYGHGDLVTRTLSWTPIDTFRAEADPERPVEVGAFG
jgi:hypothetical protein